MKKISSNGESHHNKRRSSAAPSPKKRSRSSPCTTQAEPGCITIEDDPLPLPIPVPVPSKEGNERGTPPSEDNNDGDEEDTDSEEEAPKVVEEAGGIEYDSCTGLPWGMTQEEFDKKQDNTQRHRGTRVPKDEAKDNELSLPVPVPIPSKGQSRRKEIEEREALFIKDTKEIMNNNDKEQADEKADAHTKMESSESQSTNTLCTGFDEDDEDNTQMLLF